MKQKLLLIGLASQPSRETCSEVNGQPFYAKLNNNTSRLNDLERSEVMAQGIVCQMNFLTITIQLGF